MRFLITILLIWNTPAAAKTVKNIYLSKLVYKQVPFSRLYEQDGALVKDVDFRSVNFVKKQIQKKLSIKLSDRKEAHITIITPPEFDGRFNPGKHGLHDVFTSKEINDHYSKVIKQSKFRVECIGVQKKSSEKKLVFFLIVKSNHLLNIRKHLAKEYYKRAKRKGIKAYFNPLKWDPHITIGFVNNDIHGVDKKTCSEDFKLLTR